MQSSGQWNAGRFCNWPIQPGDSARRDKERGFFATKDIIELIVRAMSFGLAWVFAPAASLAADIVLLGEATGVEVA